MKTVVTPLARRRPMIRAEPVDVASRQRRGRFVEQEDARLAEESAGDLDLLLHGEVEFARSRRRDATSPMPKRVEMRRDAAHAPGGAGSCRSGLSGPCGSSMLSRTVRSSTSVISWNAVWMPRAWRLAGRGEPNLLAEQAKSARIRLRQTGEQLDDRRLARAVLAEQRMHGAARNRETTRRRPRPSRRTPCARARRRWRLRRRRFARTSFQTSLGALKAETTDCSRRRANQPPQVLVIRAQAVPRGRPAVRFPAFQASRSRRTSRDSAPATAGRRCSPPSSPPMCLPCNI